jgi:hypothetical protein
LAEEEDEPRRHGGTEARLYYRAAMRILFSAQKKE